MLGQSFVLSIPYLQKDSKKNCSVIELLLGNVHNLHGIDALNFINFHDLEDHLFARTLQLNLFKTNKNNKSFYGLYKTCIST